MSRSPLDEYMERARQMIRQNQPRGRPPGGLGAIVGAAVVGGGFLLIQNSLFNVDGGHRAIKYRRVSGVSKEIYSEGMGRYPARRFRPHLYYYTAILHDIC